ncbi:hypothetical protein BH18THE2_BH18THE2_33450 [soil metagenome]
MPSPIDTPGRFSFYSYFHCLHTVAILVVISYLVFDLQNSIIANTDINEGNFAYAHIFSDTENAVTKNVDGKYQVAFLSYPPTPLVNDTSTKLNFSIMENNTDAPNLLTSLVIMDKVTGSVVEQTPYKFHQFGDVTYPYIFQNEGKYTVAVQVKINGDPKYESSPLVASFDVSVQNMEKLSNTFQQVILYYVTPILALIVGIVIYIESKRGRKTKK